MLAPLNLKQASTLLGCSPRTMRRMVTEGKLAYIDNGPGHSNRYLQADIERYIRDNRKFTPRKKATENGEAPVAKGMFR